MAKSSISSASLSLAMLILAACGGGGGHGSSQPPGGGTPPPSPVTYTVGVVVTGLTGNLVLQNNGGNDLTANGNGTFTFATALTASSPYNVTVKTQPTDQYCDLGTNSRGTIQASNVTVAIACTTNPSPPPPPPPGAHDLTISVTGLNGNNVVVRNNGGAGVTLGNGSTKLGTFDTGTAYAVTISAQPSYPAADCVFSGGSAGMIGNSDVQLQLNCTAFSVQSKLKASVSVFQAHGVTLTWPAVPGATSYNLYVSATPDCDFRLVGKCSEKLSNVTTNALVSQLGGQRLNNGQSYFFQLESVFATTGGGTAQGLSNKAGGRPGAVAFDGTVKSISASPDGTVYLGGAFTHVGVSTGPLIPLDTITGGFAAAQLPAVVGTVRTIVSDGGGGWYIGGAFQYVGGWARRNLAHITAAGELDPAFDHSTDGVVAALARVNNTLYVGGLFNVIEPATAGASPVNVAAINLVDGTLVNWRPNPNNSVNALATVGPAVYIGGSFTDSGNLPAFFAGFDIDGAGLPLSTNAMAATRNMVVDDLVLALAAHDATLYVGGKFGRFAGINGLRGIARVDLIGVTPTVVQDFRADPDSAFGPFVGTIVVSNDGGTVYLGGAFDTIRGPAGFEPRANLAAVAASTGQAQPWAPNPSGPVVAVALLGNTAYVAGNFNFIGSQLRTNLAAVDVSSGAALPDFQPDPPSDPRAIAVTDKAVYVGGNFQFLGGVGRNFLASLAPDGSLRGWSPSANAEVRAVLFHANGILENGATGPVVYAGGLFGFVSNQAHPKLVSLGADSGLPISRFGGIVNGGAGSSVNALAVLDTAGLYVGGSFQSIGSPAVNSPNLAKLFVNDGTINTLFKPNPNGPVNALIATHDRDLDFDVVYAGGAFTNLDGGSHLAKVNGDLGTTIQQPPGAPHPGAPEMPLADGTVNALVLDTNGFDVFVGGAFNTLQDRYPGGSVRPTPGGLADLHIDGAVRTECGGCFNPGPDPGPNNGRPQALATLGVTSVFAGGGFANIGGGPISNFAALDRFVANNGNALTRFVFPNGPVSALAVVNGKVYVGGTFTGFNPSLDGTAPVGVGGNFGVIDANTGKLVP